MSARSVSESVVSERLEKPEVPEVIRPRTAHLPNLFRLAAFTLFFALTLSLQRLGAAYRSEFAGYPDEGAHYVTGLLVRDYLAQHRLVNFQRFAENYYLHYPKVALGHWPPLLYVLEAIWTLIFPISRPSLLSLMALVTALMAFSVYRLVEDQCGRALGIMAGLLVIALPVIQASSGMVMADGLVGLFSLWATIYAARLIERETWRDALLFGVLAAMAILTKGTGFALALVPPLTLLTTRRWYLLRRPLFWLPLLIVAPLCGPWYWVTRHMLPSTWQYQRGASFSIAAARFYLRHSVHMFGPVLILLAGLGFLVELVLRRGKVSVRSAALVGLLIAIVLLACVVPAGIEERFMIPAVPVVLIFAFFGLDYIAHAITLGKLNLEKKRFIVVALLVVGFLWRPFFVPKNVSFGFAPVADYILNRPELAKSVLLVSSDATGDSMFISELAMRERRPGHYVLRASKVLCDCSWSGDQHDLKYPTPSALMGYLQHSPIQIVIEDESAQPGEAFLFHRVIEETITTYPQSWRLIASYPITRNGLFYPEGIRVYSISGTDPRAPVTIDLRRMLRKTIQLQPQ